MSIKELKKKYKQVYKLSDGNYMVSTKSQKEVSPVEYYAHTNIDEVYGLEGEWGIVDKNDKVIIKPKYIYPFIECGDNYQVMLLDEEKEIDGVKRIICLKHGLIDKNGKVIIPIKYLYMEEMDNLGTYFRVADPNTYKSGVIDKNNKIVIPFNYSYIQASPDLELMKHEKNHDIYPIDIYQVKVSNNDLYGIYDLKLKKEIISPKYGYIKVIYYNRFLIGKDYDNCNTLIDEKENIIVKDINDTNSMIQLYQRCKDGII